MRLHVIADDCKRSGYSGDDVLKLFAFRNKVWFMLGAVTLASLFVSYVILARVSFLGDMVLTQIEKAVNEQLRAEVSIAPLAGNPITGFTGKTLVISRTGVPMITAESTGIDISLRSLLTGSPRVARLTLDGLHTDYDSLLALLPESGENKGPTDIPINKIVINKSEIDSPWGLLTLDSSSVKPKNTEWFELDLSGSLAAVPAAAKGTVSKTSDGNWTLGDVKLKLADGTANLSGPAFPVPDLNLSLKNIELAEIAKLTPSIGKMLVRGSVTGNMKVKGLHLDFGISGEGTLKNAVVAGIPLTEVDAVWEYSKNLIDLKISKGNVFKSSLNGNFRLDSRGSVPHLKMDAKVTDLKFSDWTDKIASEAILSYALTNETTTAAQHLNGTISSLETQLEGPLNALTGFVKLSPSSIGYKTLRFTDIGGEAIFSGKPSGSVDFSGLYKNNKMTLNGSLSFSEKTATDLKFNAGSLELSEIASVIDGIEDIDIGGSASVSATLTGVFGKWIARGEITSQQIDGGRYGVFKNIRLMPEYRFSDGSLMLTQTSAVWNAARVTVSGTMTRGKSWGLNFAGTLNDAKTTAFETLVPFFKTMEIDAALSGTWKAGGTLAAPTVAADLNATNAKFKGIHINSFSGNLDYAPGKLTIGKIDLRVNRGKALLAADVLFPQAADGTYLPVVWNVTGTASELSGDTINSAFNLDEPFSGTVSGPFNAGNSDGDISWSMDAHGKNIGWREFRADDAKGRIVGNASVVDIENMHVSFLRGEHVINGRVTLAEKGQPAESGLLDLKVDTKKLNLYELLRKHVQTVRGFQGLIEGSASVTGTISEPLINGSGTVAPLRYRSFLLPMVTLEFGGGLSDIKVAAKTLLKEGTLTATARLTRENDIWLAEMAADGSKINLNQLGRYLPEAFREKLAGNADFTLKGGGRLDAFSGEGTFKSDRLKIWNVDVDNINAPFYISDGYAIVEDVKAKSNGGDITGGVAFDLDNNLWGGNVTVTSADIDTFIAQAVPQLPGTVSGKGELKIRAGGETGRMSSVRASGVLRLFDGELSGFSAVEAAQKFTRGKPIRFHTVQATFSYSGGFLTILPGSQAVAPKNDSVYRYMMLDGTVDENGVLGLFAMGKANIQALNALLGALQGLMSMGIDFNEPLDKAELLQGIIGGALTGFSRNDFRFVTMGIRGTYDSPRFENIKVESSTQSASSAIPTTPSDPKDDSFGSGNKVFKFRFEIPVGPGAAPGSGLDEQARGQILKNALDSLLNNSDF